MQLKAQIQELRKDVWERLDEISRIMKNEEENRKFLEKAIKALNEEIKKLESRDPRLYVNR